jgi:peptide/nickel transport system substrate-binding protein
MAEFMATRTGVKDNTWAWADFLSDWIKLTNEEVPRIPLFQPLMDVAMRKDVNGYMYWFHLQPDFRQLSKA